MSNQAVSLFFAVSSQAAARWQCFSRPPSRSPTITSPFVGAALEDDDLLAESGVLKGESRSIADKAVDELEEMGEPGHLPILTVDSACDKMLSVIPLSCGFGAADEVFGSHRPLRCIRRSSQHAAHRSLGLRNVISRLLGSTCDLGHVDAKDRQQQVLSNLHQCATALAGDADDQWGASGLASKHLRHQSSGRHESPHLRRR